MKNATRYFLGGLLFLAIPRQSELAAQDAPTAPPRAIAPAPSGTITIAAGTRLPLVLQNTISLKNAKVGDSAYFQISYPIAQDNRIVIPVGTMARGEVVSVKRPGRMKGRGELQLEITSLTFANGYTVSLTAIPESVDNDARETVGDHGTIVGGSRTAQNASTLGMATLTGLALGTYGGLIGGVATGSANALGIGAAAGGGAGLLGGLLVMALTRGPDLVIRRGITLDVQFDRPLTLDAAHLPIVDAANALPPMQSAAASDEKHVTRHCHRGLLGLSCRSE